MTHSTMFHFRAGVASCVTMSVLVFGCGRQPSAEPTMDNSSAAAAIEYPSDSLETIRDRIALGAAQLLDVRSQAEWNEGCLQEATHIPMKTLAAAELRMEALDQLDKTKPVYIHCMQGGRAQKAAELLGQLGFDARPIVVNFAELPRAGFTEVKPTAAPE